MKWLGTRLRYALLILLASSAFATTADEFETLQADGRLQLTRSISPSENLVPGQKITLTMKVATDRWFSGGTRINIPEVPGLVILQTEQFARNASESRDGQSWVIQRWTLDVFPQQAGDFTIPPIQVQVKVNAGEAGDLEGTLSSPATRFSATIPEPLAQAEQWVAAPAFEVSQNFDRALEGLQVGDAFEREIRFEEQDVMAMMLPSFSAEKLPGLATYPSPPVLANDNNRGQAVARRTQRISYVVEGEGRYQLPEQEYFWWDTQRGELSLLTLPTTEIVVGTGESARTSAAVPATVDLTPRQLLAGLAGLVALAGMLWLARKWLPRLPLARVTSVLSHGWHQLKALRRPALPERLNPGSNAGD